MAIKAGQKYNGTVAPGSHLFETQTGTMGYQVMLDCPDGQTSFSIWLTEKNRERARKAFDVLGVHSEMLKDQNYIEYQLGIDIDGKEVSFGTKEEEYNGNRSVKVVWIGKKSDPNLSRSAANFFGGSTGNTNGSGKPPKTDPVTTDGPITDDDIPF